MKYPTPEDFDRLNLDRSFAIYKEIFGNAYGMHYSFVGNIDVEKAKPFWKNILVHCLLRQKKINSKTMASGW